MKSENNFISSGFTKLDQITGGLQNGELVIIGGRPSMGKTAFMLSMARNMAIEQGNAVAVFSLEMSRNQLFRRLGLMETGFTNSENLEPQKKELFEAAVIKVINERTHSVEDFSEKCRQLIQQHGICAVFIDYLQLMTWWLNRQNRELEIASILRSLKDAAKELNIPIIATSQLNRPAENRSRLQGKRPMLSDLTGCDCAVFEQNADVIAFIHRPAYHGFTEDEYGNSLKDAAEIIVAKNRNDKPDSVWLTFDNNSGKFIDKEPQRVKIPKELTIEVT